MSFENETRVMHLANTASYAELLETVRLKFPSAWPCQIKYLDRRAHPQLLYHRDCASTREHYIPLTSAFELLQ